MTAAAARRRRRATPLAVAIALALACATAAQAAPPANDAFASPATLPLGVDVAGLNVGATAEPTEPSLSFADNCATLAERPDCGTSVWYTFTPATAGTYTIETCDAGTEIDTVLAVYTGPALDALTQVATNDDGSGPECDGGPGGNGSQVTFPATANTPYHVVVTGFAADEGAFYLRAYSGQPVPRPAPETRIVATASLLDAQVQPPADTPGVRSGPRHSASFAFTSPQVGATFACSFDGAPFAACTSPASFDGLAPDTTHTFAVRAAVGALTDPTPALATFTLDDTPPTTTIAGTSGDTNSTEGIWQLSGNEINHSGQAFRCALDSEPLHLCTDSPVVLGLCRGPHTFAAAEWDVAANIAATPPSVDINETSATTRLCATPAIAPSSASTNSGSAVITTPVDSGGAGAQVHIDYGLTTAYGMTVPDVGVDPDPTPGTTPIVAAIDALEPATAYHYRVTVTTPFGAASTGDQTFTTTAPAAGVVRPAVTNGTPIVVGHHAAHVPFSVDAGGLPTRCLLLVSDDGPATLASTTLGTRLFVSGQPAGPQPLAFDVVDLAPGTYHYRLLAAHTAAAEAMTLGPDGTFTIPPIPPPPVTAPTLPTAPPTATTPSPPVTTAPPPTTTTPPPPLHAHFALKRSQVSIARLTHRSRTLTVRLRGLPARTHATVTLTIGARHVTVSKTAPKGATTTVAIRLSAALRAALRAPARHTVRVAVSVTPPGDTRSAVTVTARVAR